MDNLCHTLAGAALGDAGLKHRTALGMGTLLIASNLPDIDVLVFATDTLPMSFRRGWTHGVLAMVVLPAAFGALMYACGRYWRQTRAGQSPVRLSSLLLLAYVGTWLHVFMDYLNSYGIRLLMPFSEHWFYGDALYIIDPLLYLMLGGAIAWGRGPALRGASARPRAARVGLALAGAYMAVMLAMNSWGRAEVRHGLDRAGVSPDTRFMVTPVLANPFKREVVVDMGDRYEKGFVWFEPAPHFRPAGYGVDTYAADPAAVQAAQTPRGRAYLRWSRFPFFVIEPAGSNIRVRLNDYRFAGPGGRDTWLSTTVTIPAPDTPGGSPE